MNRVRTAGRQGEAMNTFLVYMTMQDRDEAERIAGVLIEERLVACVNILGGCESLFWWDGAVQKESEVVMLAKTSQERLESLTERINVLHSYDVPCIVALKIDSGNPAFLTWIQDVTGPRT